MSLVYLLPTFCSFWHLLLVMVALLPLPNTLTGIICCGPKGVDDLCFHKFENSPPPCQYLNFEAKIPTLMLKFLPWDPNPWPCVEAKTLALWSKFLFKGPNCTVVERPSSLPQKSGDSLWIPFSLSVGHWSSRIKHYWPSLDFATIKNCSFPPLPCTSALNRISKKIVAWYQWYDFLQPWWSCTGRVGQWVM